MSWFARTAALGLALAAVLVVCSSAAAGVAGEVRYDLSSPEEAEIEATLILTDEQARDLRERADRDDSGDVGALEAAGARSVIDDRVEGETDAYTMDGAVYTNDGASVGTEDLQGPVDDRNLTLEIEAEASVSAGEAPHVFAIHGLPANLTGEVRVVHEVLAPEGHVVEEAEGFAVVEECRARTEPGPGQARATFASSEDACDRGIPAAGLSATVGATLAAALVLGDRRQRGSRPPK